jgi:hypothetical protein
MPLASRLINLTMVTVRVLARPSTTGSPGRLVHNDRLPHPFKQFAGATTQITSEVCRTSPNILDCDMLAGACRVSEAPLMLQPEFYIGHSHRTLGNGRRRWVSNLDILPYLIVSKGHSQCQPERSSNNFSAQHFQHSAPFVTSMNWISTYRTGTPAESGPGLMSA